MGVMGISHNQTIAIDRAVARRLARARADAGVPMNIIADEMILRGLAELDREAAAGGGPLTDAINARHLARRKDHAKS
jgi:hypothetical protein